MALYRDTDGYHPVPAGYTTQKPIAVLLEDIDGETDGAVASAAIHGLVKCEDVTLADGSPATDTLVTDFRAAGIYLAGDPADSAGVPTVIQDLANAAVTEGDALTLSFVVDTADDGELTYQWYSNTSASALGGTAISGATGSSYQVDTPAAGTKYLYCVATNTLNGTTAQATSAVATVVISQA
jgi:hypothetical protein